MGNLIIIIISILLIVVTSAITMDYSGDIYTSRSVEGEAAKMRNERNQIIAAMEVFRSDGNDLKSMFKFTDLTKYGYLTKVPDGWIAEDSYAYRELDRDDPGSMAVCWVANRQDGYKYFQTDIDTYPVPKDSEKAIPYCDKEGIPSTLPCCINRVVK